MSIYTLEQLEQRIAKLERDMVRKADAFIEERVRILESVQGDLKATTQNLEAILNEIRSSIEQLGAQVDEVVQSHGERLGVLEKKVNKILTGKEEGDDGDPGQV